MLQIVTFNIGGARKLRQPPHDPARLGKDVAALLNSVIDKSQPTFIGLQETGWIAWQGGETQAAHQSLANALGERYTAGFAPELDSQRHPHERLWGRDVYAGMQAAAEGNGFVTNLPPADWGWSTHTGTSAHWLSTQISEATVYSTGDRDTQPRNLVVASVLHPSYGPLYVLNTHLGTITGEDRHNTAHPRTQAGENRRRAQAKQVLGVLAELRAAEIANRQAPRPVLLLGDFNATPDAPTLADLQTQFTLLAPQNSADDRWTHTGHRIHIDHILVSDPAEVLPAARCLIPADMSTDLTDHRPVVAVFGDI